MESVVAALPSPWLIAAVFVIIVAAAVVQAGLGMGFGLLAAPLLALIAPDLVPVPTLWMGFLTSFLAAWSDRTGVVWSEVWFGSVGRLVGVVLAVAVLAVISSGPAFPFVFGVMVGLAVLFTLSGWQLAFNKTSLFSMATVSGLMGTITSVGAPPMALIYQTRPASVARPTVAAFFAVGVAISLAGLYVAGLAGMRDLLLAGLMVPPMILGTQIGRRVRSRFDRRYQPYLLAVSGGAAVILILRGLSGWGFL